MPKCQVATWHYLYCLTVYFAVSLIPRQAFSVYKNKIVNKIVYEEHFLNI